MRTNLVFLVNLLAAAAAQCRPAGRAKTILDKKFCFANGTLAGKLIFVWGLWRGNGRYLIILFQNFTTVRANHRIRIDFLIAVAANDRKFSTTATTNRIISSHGGAAGRTKLLITFRANISIVRDDCAAVSTAR
jgi:hypothetical protein